MTTNKEPSPGLMTTPAIRGEIAKLSQRPYKSHTKWAMRLFTLRQELAVRDKAESEKEGTQRTEAA